MAKLVTVSSLVDASLKSGYKHVGRNVTSEHPSSKPYQGYDSRRNGGRNHIWKGPRRSTPEQAAQDYCDYINGGVITPTVTLARVDKSTRPMPKRRAVSAREKELRRELRREIAANPRTRLHESLCYLVGITGDIFAVKVGYADYNVYSRLDSLQTGNPRTLVLLGTLPGGIETEKKLHAKYADTNILQEWFRPTTALLQEFGLTLREYTRKVKPCLK